MAEPGLDPVTGEVLETPEMRESGLRELRAKMSADTDVQKWPRGLQLSACNSLLYVDLFGCKYYEDLGQSALLRSKFALRHA